MQQEIKGDSSSYKLLLSLKNKMDIDEIRGGGTIYT